MELRHYQQESFDAMFGKDAFLLLDDPGLGKTVVQAMEIAKLGARTNLIACPVTAMGVWEYHLNLLVPDLRVSKWPTPPQQGTTTLISIDNVGGRRPRNPGPGRPSMSPREELRKGIKWDMFIIDEAHSVKNRNAKRSKVARKLRHRYEMLRLLSGTLPDNRPDELWHPLHMGWPKDFPAYNAFFEEFVDYYKDEWGFKHVKGPKNTEQLKQLLYGDGRAIRHLKKIVMPELPEKYYQYIPIEMGPQQRRVYEQMRRESLAWVGSLSDQPLPAPVVIAQLIRLGQFASAYAELDDEGNARLSFPSNKVDALLELLEGRTLPVVVFSVSTQLLELARQKLVAKGYSVGIIKGGVPANERTSLTERFQAGNIDVMLLQTRAGGVAITLTAADTAIFLDRDWAPGANDQAEDRLHRWGQKNAVEIIVFQSVGTIDMRKERTLNTKKEWIRQMLD